MRRRPKISSPRALTGVAATAVAALGVGTAQVPAQDVGTPESRIAAAAANVACDKVGAKTGSDSAGGTLGDPYRTPQKLVDSLSAGQTGCLREGIYAETTNVRIGDGGKSSSPITLRGYPGERGEIVAQVVVAEAANHVKLTDLVINGEGAPPCNRNAAPECAPALMPTLLVNGDDVVISRSEITNHNTAICINAGTNTAERAVRLTIRGNRIHHCGLVNPRTNHHHGVYLGRTNDVEVIDNWIYANADRGVQFYPEANGSYVARNVIDGNGAGVAISGASGVASNDNLVEHNLITNSVTWNVYSWYPEGNQVGKGNLVRENCVHGGRLGNIQQPTDGIEGFTAHNNLLVDPQYVDRSAANFNLRPGGPCRRLLRSFGFGKAKKNKRKGTAKLRVKVPGSGAVKLARTTRVKGAEKRAKEKGKAKLSVRARRKAKRKLNRTGRAKVRARVTYTPDGGEPTTRSRKVKLVKR
jgi:hypothetical protein